LYNPANNVTEQLKNGCWILVVPQWWSHARTGLWQIVSIDWHLDIEDIAKW